MPIGINIDFGFSELGNSDKIKKIADSGFDSTFFSWKKKGDTEKIANELEKNGLLFQSVHAPFDKIHMVWEESNEGERVIDELILCTDECSACGVKIMISHAFIGFGEERPTDIGIKRFSRLLDEAEKKNVKIAFENTEGEAYLEYIKSKLWEHPALGFCYDSGHENCYNVGRDILATYGDKLIATHLNDNFGCTGGVITYLDDSHMLPHDGSINWSDMLKRLSKTGFDGVLTFEMTTMNKPQRNTHDIYASLSCVEYLNRLYAEAKQIEREYFTLLNK